MRYLALKSTLLSARARKFASFYLYDIVSYTFLYVLTIFLCLSFYSFLPSFPPPSPLSPPFLNLRGVYDISRGVQGGFRGLPDTLTAMEEVRIRKEYV